MNQYKGEEFLLKIYQDLVNSELVKNSGKGGNKYKDVRAYMERLERITKKGLEHDNLRLMKEAYYNKYIIKPENVPESYFKVQEQIALNRGFGHVHYNEATKQQEIEQIINEQKSSLDTWIDYFASEDTKMYPTWFKYYCFQGMVRLGYLDKKTNKYTKRTESTAKPFIEINREALAMVYEELIKSLNKEFIDDKKIEELLKNGSFSKIYAYCIKKLDSIKKSKTNSDEGIWKKYLKNSNPNILFNDIHGKGTGWCTAGGLETATTHLKDGDFYVYFTKDENGEYTCPRIAIRMENNKIAEIRGIAENQNLESNMEKVVEEKLEEFPDKEEYKKKCKDMEMLTYIYTKWKNNNNTELTKEEIKFIYEIDDKIIGFGYQEDPRIQEIINARPNIKDLNIVFAGIDIWEKGLDLSCLTSAEGLVLPKTINGNLDLSCLTSTKGLVLPETITGDLNLIGLTSTEGLVLPKTINGNLCLRGLTSAKGLVLPETINGSLFLDGLISAEGLALPKTINGSLSLDGLTSAKGLVLPKTINGNLCLRGLQSALGLILPKTIKGELDLFGLTSAEGLVLPKTMTGSLSLNCLTSAEGLVLPETITGDLSLNCLTSAEGLVLPKTINGSLSLYRLTSAEGLVLPKTINRSLSLYRLTSAEGLVLPKTINGNLDLSCLTSTKGLVLPETITGDLNLIGLTSAEGLKLPEKINGSLFLDGLISAEGLVLPKTINGDLDLSGLTSAKGLILPETINGSLVLRSLTSTEGLTLPKIINGVLNLKSLTSAEGLKLPKKIKSVLFLDKLTSVENMIIPNSLYCGLSCPLANDDINMLKQMCKKENKKKKNQLNRIKNIIINSFFKKMIPDGYKLEKEMHTTKNAKK